MVCFQADYFEKQHEIEAYLSVRVPITACCPDELCVVGNYLRVRIERLGLRWTCVSHGSTVVGRGAASYFWCSSEVSRVCIIRSSCTTWLQSIFDFEFDEIALLLPHPSLLSCVLAACDSTLHLPASRQMKKYVQQGGDVNKLNKLGDTPMHEVRTYPKTSAVVYTSSRTRIVSPTLLCCSMHFVRSIEVLQVFSHVV